MIYSQKMTLHFEEPLPIKKMRGIGGFFVLKKQKIPTFKTSEVSINKVPSVKEVQQTVDTAKSQAMDSITNLNNHVLSGNELNNVDMTTMKSLKRKEIDSKSLPKSKRTKKKDMEIFNSNFFK